MSDNTSQVQAAPGGAKYLLLEDCGVYAWALCVLFVGATILIRRANRRPTE